MQRTKDEVGKRVREDNRIALRALKVSYSDAGEGGVAVNFEKKHNSS